MAKTKHFISTDVNSDHGIVELVYDDRHSSLVKLRTGQHEVRWWPFEPLEFIEHDGSGCPFKNGDDVVIVRRKSINNELTSAGGIIGDEVLSDQDWLDVWNWGDDQPASIWYAIVQRHEMPSECTEDEWDAALSDIGGR